MNVLDAVRDKNLFGPFLGARPETWRHWFSALRVLYGLPLGEGDAECVARCTGRAASTMPRGGFSTALFLTGRRSGKSRTAAVVGAYEAVLGGHEGKLAKGERGVVAICAPRTAQGRIVKDYLRAAFEAPLLKAEVARETPEGFELRSGTRIEVMAGDFRTVRGFTLLACVIDEAAFFGYEAESKVKSDAELIRAVRPALATTGGKLVCVTSPYAKKGWCYDQFRKHFGVAASKVLVWNAPSRAMNPTLPQSVVDDALADDLQAARSEYLAEFRDDVAEFLPRAVVEAVVDKGRVELPPAAGVRYSAFADLSGGRSDDATLAVGHREGAVVVVDALRRYKAPCDPYHVVALMAELLRRFGLARVTGDNYAADFVAGAFGRHGVRYQRCLKPKSALYLELLPRLCAGGVELPDSPDLVAQLCGLERRTRSGGRDSIDHGRDGKDDLANAVAGVAEAAGVSRRRAGAVVFSRETLFGADHAFH